MGRVFEEASSDALVRFFVRKCSINNVIELRGAYAESKLSKRIGTEIRTITKRADCS